MHRLSTKHKGKNAHVQWESSTLRLSDGKSSGLSARVACKANMHLHNHTCACVSAFRPCLSEPLPNYCANTTLICGSKV